MTLSPEQRYQAIITHLESIEKKLDALTPSMVKVKGPIVPILPVNKIVPPVHPDELPKKGEVSLMIKARRGINN